MVKKKFKKFDCIFNAGTFGDSAYMIDFGKVGIIAETNKNDKRNEYPKLRIIEHN